MLVTDDKFAGSGSVVIAVGPDATAMRPWV